MHAIGVLDDPVCRRFLELLSEGEQAAGAVSAVVQEEFGSLSRGRRSISTCCTTTGSPASGPFARAVCVPSTPRP